MDQIVARYLQIIRLTEDQITKTHNKELEIDRQFVGYEFALNFDLPTYQPTNGWHPDRMARGPITESEQKRIYAHAIEGLNKYAGKFNIEDPKFSPLLIQHCLDWEWHKKQADFAWRDPKVKTKKLKSEEDSLSIVNTLKDFNEITESS